MWFTMYREFQKLAPTHSRDLKRPQTQVLPMKISAICFWILLFTMNIVIAQDNKKLSRKEKKALKKEEQIAQNKAILALLESKQWVIEAHTVFDRYNQSYQINPTINFVGVRNEEGALQLGFDGLIGWNGVGGVTIDGKITRYEIKQVKERANPSINIRFQGRGVSSATINVSVNSSGQATAKVNGDFGDRITFTGMIKSLEESVVYKGQSLF